MGVRWIILPLIITGICAISLLMGGVGTLIAYIIQKRRGGRLFRRFILIPVFSLVLGAVFISYSAFLTMALRTGNEDSAAPASLTAYYDEDYNITLSGKQYIDIGYLSGQAILSEAPIANLRETAYSPDMFNKMLGDIYEDTPLYSVTNETESDLITDGYYLYCEASQLELVKAFYNDLGNYIYHRATEEEWYDYETSELPVIDIDGQRLNSMSALESGTVLELRREIPVQEIVYLVPVSRDGVTEKFFELLHQNDRLFLIYSESYEFDETVYACFKLPDTTNAYLLDVLFQSPEM